MRPTIKNKARKALIQLEKLIAKAKITKYDWDEARKNKTYKLHDCISSLERYPIDPDHTPRKYLEEMYKDALKNVKSIDDDGHGDDVPELDELYQLINQLPPELPKELVPTNQILNLNPLQAGLWKFFDDHEITFGLGDDGTDEAEQDMEKIAYLLDICQDPLKSAQLSFFQNPMHTLEDILIRNELLDECPIFLHMSINDAMMFLKHYITDNPYSEASAYFIDYIIKNNIK